jgi:hypothetical protein
MIANLMDTSKLVTNVPGKKYALMAFVTSPLIHIYQKQNLTGNHQKNFKCKRACAYKCQIFYLKT